NRRKGFPELAAALTKLETKAPVTGIVFGGGHVEIPNSRLAQVRCLGYVNHPRRQALIYSAADMVVVPSLEDNLPNVGLEALSSGTPVIGFDIGGIPDYVRPHETGLLARPCDTTDLARQIDWLADRPADRVRMGRRARDLAVREFDQAVQARKYAE